MNIFKVAPNRPLSDGHWTIISNEKKPILETVLCVLFTSICLITLKYKIISFDWIIDFLHINFHLRIYVLENIIFRILIYLSFVMLLTILHEFLHIIVMPGSIFSDKNYLYIERGIVTVFHDDEMVRERYLLMLFMPFLVLSILPFILSVYINNNLAIVLMTIAMINLVVSYIDITYLIIYLITVPKNTLVDKNHYKIINDHSFVQLIERDFNVVLVKTETLYNNTEKGIQDFWINGSADGTMERIHKLINTDQQFLAISDFQKKNDNYYVAVEDRDKIHYEMKHMYIDTQLWGCFETCGDQPLAMQVTSQRIGEWLNSSDYSLRKNMKIDVFHLKDPYKVQILIPIEKKVLSNN